MGKTGMDFVKLRTLIVDDEPLAREKIRAFLEEYREFEVIGECQDGEHAGIAILARRPDVVFLDVEIPGQNGIELLNSLPPNSQPYIVVVTAFDRYAVRAFEIEAVDYLLKPFDKIRFAQTVKRLCQASAFSHLDGGPVSNAAFPKSHDEVRGSERVLIKSGSRIIVVRGRSIEWIEAQGDYVLVHAQKSSHLVRETMTTMEARLDPTRFARIHRSAIVNLDFIRELHPLWGGDYRVILQDGTQLTLSRNYRSVLRERLSTLIA
jgi:two-component system, LytTR family, response regulator